MRATRPRVLEGYANPDGSGRGNWSAVTVQTRPIAFGALTFLVSLAIFALVLVPR